MGGGFDRGMIKKVFLKLHRGHLQRKFHLSSWMSSVLSQDYMKDYGSSAASKLKIYKIHRKGFSLLDWSIMGCNDSNYKDYISTVQYYGLHPVNGSFTKWIDDKLTLKYVLHGSDVGKYMPDYYAFIDQNGKLSPLMDAPEKENFDYDSLVSLLKDKGELALKLVAGSIGQGFYKAYVGSDGFFLNSESFTEEDFKEKLKALRGYLVCEYLHPHPKLAKICPNTTNTLRYLIARDEQGKRWVPIRFIRFGTVASGFVENYACGGVLCIIDEQGRFSDGYLLDSKTFTNTVVSEHPDSKCVLTGTIPNWDKIEAAANEIMDYLPQMRYMGIDFVLTDDNRLKMLEINSLPSLDALQIDGPLLTRPEGRFYKELLSRK